MTDIIKDNTSLDSIKNEISRLKAEIIALSLKGGNPVVSLQKRKCRKQIASLMRSLSESCQKPVSE